MTADDCFSDEEDNPHTSEYHSPPEDLSGSEEEEERGRATMVVSARKRAQQSERGRREQEQGSSRSKRPQKVVGNTPSEPVGEPSNDHPPPPPEERQRAGSERLYSFGGGILSPVQESPEYACTPSSAGSADELESDLNRALSQLDSETSGLQADAREVEYIEQKAAQLSEANSQSSNPPSPFPTSVPTTPNTVVWQKGKCVEISSTVVKPEAEGGSGGKNTEGGGKGEGGGMEKEREKKKEERGGGGSGDFDAIPKVAPSLGLKEGHDRRQLGVARSCTRRRPPSRPTNSLV